MKPLLPWLAFALVLSAGCRTDVSLGFDGHRCEDTVQQAVAPGVRDEFRTADFWVRQAGDTASRPLMAAVEITSLNARAADRTHGFQDVFGDAVAAPRRVKKDLEERSAWLQARVSDGRYVESEDGAFEVANTIVRSAVPMDEVRIVVEDARLACIPMDAGLFKPPIDIAFDRNQCSELHPGEVLRVLRRWSPESSTEKGTWFYVHTGHSVGWVRSEFVTPAVDASAARAFRDATDRVVALDDGVHLRLGRSFPLVRETEDAWVVTRPSVDGLGPSHIPKSEPVRRGFQRLTKQAVFSTALAHLDAPYGWGGFGGHRDCSRFVMDVLGSFGLRLPRFSGHQSRAGWRTVELRGKTEAEKLAALAQASEGAVVLLYMRGHIMLYLGMADGRPWAISSISEYRRPCSNGDIQTVRLDRVAVTDLELGRGTERTAFIERIERLAVFGR